MKLQIIVGSTRPTRAADKVVPWVASRAASHAEFETEVLDLRDWQLPMFGEHFGSIGDPEDPSYSGEIVRRWNRKIAEADAYLIITPEYNHSVPGELKNAIDSVFVSFGFRNKPMTFVGYSAGVGAGIRSIEHLNQIATEVEAVPLRSVVVLPFVVIVRLSAPLSWSTRPLALTPETLTPARVSADPMRSSSRREARRSS